MTEEPQASQEHAGPEASAAPGTMTVEDLAESFFFTRSLFHPPGAAQWAWLTSSGTAMLWEALAACLDLDDDSPDADRAPPGGAGQIPPSMGLPESAEQYEVEFIAAFEVGAPHPPVPLIESHYTRCDPVPRLLHENILFYQAFGLRLKPSAGETPDHLRHELEFAGYLCQLEAAELRGSGDAERLTQIRQARHEYVTRHLLSWLPAAAEKACAAPSPWVRRYLALVLALARRVVAGAGPAPRKT